MLAAPFAFGACGALLGVDEVERADGAGAAGALVGGRAGGAGANPAAGAAGADAPPGPGGQGPAGGGGSPAAGAGGGQSGRGGDGAGGGAPDACDAADGQEPNDAPGNATPLRRPAGDSTFTPCDVSVPVEGTFGRAGDDWFFARGIDNSALCPFAPAPRVQIDSEEAAELCLYVRPDDGGPTSCPSQFGEDQSTMPDGLGCCGRNEAEVIFGGNRARVFVRLRRAPDEAGVCSSYTLNFDY